MRVVVLAIAIGLGAGAASSCTLVIDPGIACGDGFIDRDAGEQCEPTIHASFADACAETPKQEGLAACTADCQIDNSPEQCAKCGDGTVDPDEECDGDNLAGRVCPGGEGQLQCDNLCRLDFSECEPCGDGHTDEDEECDPNDIDAVAEEKKRECATLASPFPDQEYSHGKTEACTESCRYDRLPCSYCGNGKLDGELLIDGVEDHYSLPERCDDRLFDEAFLRAEHTSFCFNQGEGVRPNVTCAENCIAFEVNEGADCCLTPGTACPEEDDPYRCCYETAGRPGEPCDFVINGENQLTELCR